MLDRLTDSWAGAIEFVDEDDAALGAALRAVTDGRVRYAAPDRGPASIRAGAGIAYDFVNQQFYHNSTNVAPFAGDTTVNGPIPLDNPWSTTPGGNDPRTQQRDPKDPPPPDDDKSTGRIALRETKRTQAKSEGSSETLPKYQDLIQAYRKNLSGPEESP